MKNTALLEHRSGDPELLKQRQSLYKLLRKKQLEIELGLQDDLFQFSLIEEKRFLIEFLESLLADTSRKLNILPDDWRLSSEKKVLQRMLDSSLGLPDKPDTSIDLPYGYTVVRQINQGGMGAIYLANDGLSDVAIKVLFFTGKDKLAHAKDEAKLIRGLSNHPNIINVYAYKEHNGYPFIIMEYFNGVNLWEYVVEGTDKRLKLQEFLSLSLQLISALEYAHKHKVIHRDIHPGNVMISREGIVKLLDFGLAEKVFGDLYKDKTGEIVGYPPYMAPEQFSKYKTVDHRSDIYSAGVLFYELLSGQNPFPHEIKDDPIEILQAKLNCSFPSIRQLTPEIPAQLEQVIMTCLKADPQNRYQSVSDLKRDLKEAFEVQSVWSGTVLYENTEVDEMAITDKPAGTDTATCLAQMPIADVMENRKAPLFTKGFSLYARQIQQYGRRIVKDGSAENVDRQELPVKVCVREVCRKDNQALPAVANKPELQLFDYDLKQTWTFKMDKSISSCPECSGRFIYFGSPDQKVYCLDITSGSVRWTFTGTRPFTSSATVADNRLYIGDDGGSLYCLNADQGGKHWNVTALGGILNKPLFFDNKIIFGSTDSRLYIIDALSGRCLKKWIKSGFRFWAWWTASPVQYDEMVYLTNYLGSVCAVDLKAMKLVWEYGTNYPIWATPEVTECFIAAGDLDGCFHLVDRSTGICQDLLDFGSPIKTGLQYKNKRFYGVTLNGLIFCYDICKGKLLWQEDLGFPVNCRPVLLKDHLLVIADNGLAYDINLVTREREVKVEGLFINNPNPMLYDNKIIVPTINNTITCYSIIKR